MLCYMEWIKLALNCYVCRTAELDAVPVSVVPGPFFLVSLATRTSYPLVCLSGPRFY